MSCPVQDFVQLNLYIYTRFGGVRGLAKRCLDYPKSRAGVNLLPNSILPSAYGADYATVPLAVVLLRPL